MPTELPPRNRSGPPPLLAKAVEERSIRFDESPIHLWVSGVRSCVRTGGFGRVAVWLGTMVTGIILLDVALGLPAHLRAIAGWLILGGLLALAANYFLLKPRRVTAADATRKIESDHPEFGQLLRTARDAAAGISPVSPVLRSELFRRAGLSLAGLDVKQHLPRTASRRWLLGGAAAIFGFCAILFCHHEAPIAFNRLLSPYSGVTFTHISDTTQDRTFDKSRLPRVEAVIHGRPVADVSVWVTHADGTETSYPMNRTSASRYEATLPPTDSSFTFRMVAGDSKPATGLMECVDPAEFISSASALTFPDYTGRPRITQESADLEAVEGTLASLQFKMSAPMSRASLKLPGGTQLPLHVEGAEISTTLAVAVGGDYAELTGTDARGHDIAPVQFKHVGQADTLPAVEWVEPTKDIDVTAITEIPLRLRIRDDFGVATYGVVLEARGDSKELLTQSIEAKDLKDLSEMTTAALESFPLTIRDNVRMYAWATDHKPRAGARAVSALRSVDIRAFKRKWQMSSGGGGGPPPVTREEIKKVEELIKAQRVVLSDAFVIIQAPAPPAKELKTLSTDESALQMDTLKLHAAVLDEGQWPADDIHLLAAAGSQMGESAMAWSELQPRPGFQQADAALSTLLELRKNLLTLLMKSENPTDSAPPEEVPEEMADLAQEAERLAKEERDVATQLAGTEANARFTAIRRQQDVADSDTGELFAKLMDHPEATPESLALMGDAEKNVKLATRATRSNEAATAAPSLLTPAAEALDAVASHLRALDEANLDETLAKMAEEAKKAAETAKAEASEKPAEAPNAPDELASNEGEKPADNAGEKPAAGEEPGKAPGEGESPAPGEGKSPSEMAGDKPSQGKGQGAGQAAAPSEQASKGEGNSPTDSPGPAASDGKAPAPGNDQPAEDLASSDPNAGNRKGPGETPTPSATGAGPAATPGPARENSAEERKEALAKAARQAALNDDILKFFATREADAGQESRFEDLRNETQSASLAKQLNEVAEGKSPGSQTSENLLGFAAALEREREARRQSLLENLAKAHEKAAELKKQAEAQRAAARKAELQDGGPSGFPVPTDETVAANPNGSGKGSATEPGSPPKGSSAGQGADELAHEVSRFKDPELTRVAASLRAMAPDLSDIRPLVDAERRLAQMMQEISGLARSDNSEEAVPPAYRRAVEDYFRALSDDFGDEEPFPR